MTAWADTLLVAVWVLSIPCLLKAIALIQTIRWMMIAKREQLDYVSTVRRSAGGSRSARMYAFARAAEFVDAMFFPFGLRDARILRVLGDERRSRPFRLAVEVLYEVFYRLPFLAVEILGITVALSTVMATSPPFGNAHLAAWSLYAIALVCLTGAVLLALEAIVAHAYLGGYSLLFHGYRLEDSRFETRVIRELEIFVFTIAVAAVSATVLAVAAAVPLRGFHGFADPTGATAHAALNHLVDGVYFVATTFSTIGYGDLHPVTPSAKVATISIEATAFALIILGLSTVSLLLAHQRARAANTESDLG